MQSPKPDGTVHLCLDMQRLFGRDGPWPTPWMERVLPKYRPPDRSHAGANGLHPVYSTR